MQIGAHADLRNGQRMYYIGNAESFMEDVDVWLADKGLRRFREHVNAAQKVPHCLFLTWKSTNANALCAFMNEATGAVELTWLVDVDDAGDAARVAPQAEDVRLGCRVIEHYRDAPGSEARTVVFSIASDRESRVVARKTGDTWAAGCEVQVEGEAGPTPLWCHYVYLDIAEGAVLPRRAYALTEDMEGRIFIVTRKVSLSVSDIVQNALQV